jgi:hypothetical protein
MYAFGDWQRDLIISNPRPVLPPVIRTIALEAI